MGGKISRQPFTFHLARLTAQLAPSIRLALEVRACARARREAAGEMSVASAKKEKRRVVAMLTYVVGGAGVVQRSAGARRGRNGGCSPLPPSPFLLLPPTPHPLACPSSRPCRVFTSRFRECSESRNPPSTRCNRSSTVFDCNVVASRPLHVLSHRMEGMSVGILRYPDSKADDTGSVRSRQ